MKAGRRWLLVGLAAFLGLAFWLWVPRPPLLPDPGGRLRREEQGLVFDGRHKADILSTGQAVLTVEYAHVRDNGEEWWPIHGPYGSLHVAIYDTSQPPGPPWREGHLLSETMLYGPHLTTWQLYEWLDGETLNYQHYGLYAWERDRSQVVLRLYEADPGPGRQHDDLLVATVSRPETEHGPLTLHSPAIEVTVRTTDLE